MHVNLCKVRWTAKSAHCALYEWSGNRGRPPPDLNAATDRILNNGMQCKAGKAEDLAALAIASLP